MATCEPIDALKFGKLVRFSEKFLVDCAHNGCHGCHGGSMSQAVFFIAKENKGKVASEADYPYFPQTRPCHYNESMATGSITGYVRTIYGDDDNLAAAIQQRGPASVGIDAGHYSFQAYRHGLYDEPACSSRNLDHGVGCVGWGSEKGVKFWIIRNSWGARWGEKGYIRMVWKKNQCGVSSRAIIATA
jgi:cathepsin L